MGVALVLDIDVLVLDGVGVLDLESDLLNALNTRLVRLDLGVLDVLVTGDDCVPQVDCLGNPERSREVIPPGVLVNARLLDVALEVAY